MKIVFLEKDILGAGIDYSRLDELGEVIYYPMSDAGNTAERIKDADVVVVNKVVMNEALLKDAQNLKFIAEIATGYNNVDLEYCRQRGIGVSNVPGYSTYAVAQHTFALLLSLTEHIREYDDFVKSGDYGRSGKFSDISKPFYELHGKTWGIIGLGAIGREVAKIAQAFGCRVIYYSASGRNANPDYERVEFDELLAQCDIISIHAPLNEKTQYLMNLEAFGKMKNTAVLINVGRGPIVKEEDLCIALKEGMIAGAGLDVFEKEPLSENAALIKEVDGRLLVGTPHIGWGANEARQRMFDINAENIAAWMKGEKLNRVD